MLFELKQSLNLKLQQQLVMTPQLQQAIKLLQLSRMELVDAIQAELEQNPALEEDIRRDAEVVDNERAILGEAPTSHENRDVERAQEVSGDQASMKEIDWQQWLENYNSTPSGNRVKRAETDDLPTIEQTLSSDETLTEHLQSQLAMLHLCDEDLGIAAEILGALDERGFLTLERPLEDIAIRLEKRVAHVRRVLEIIQSLDPAGIGARDLSECLRLQLERLDAPHPLAKVILEKHMDDLEKRNFQNIAKELEVELDEVGEALKTIQSLDPRPTRNFGTDRSVYITPDIYVQRVGDDYEIMMNEDGLPMLKISGYYQKALKEGMNGEAKEYVQDKLRSAQWLIRSIHQRQRTIYKVVESILKFQREFFDRGIAHLKPLILKDVAEDIGMHESTISRVTTNKYVHTPQGIFELKYFFNSSIGKGDGDSMASVSVKHRIKKIIEDENPKKPFSDQAIVNMLKSEDIKIARRTVAKYREALGILSSSKRKQII